MPRLALATLFAAAALAGLAPAAARADAPPPPAPAAATASAFTPAQRAEIVSIVRQALMRDPTILADAIGALRDAEQRQQASSQTAAVASHAAALAAAPDGAVAGNPAGRVTLVEFYDPRCPYCRRMVPTVNAAIAADPQLRVVFRVIPILGAPSTLAARAIAAAGLRGRYVAMQERLMNSEVPATDATVAAAARAIGLDPAAIRRDMDSPAVTRQLTDNLALAHALGIDGTPAFVVGGAVIPGAMSEADLQQAVKAAEG